MYKAFKNVSLICFGILMGLFLIEIILRFYNPLPARVLGNEIRLVGNYERDIEISSVYQMTGLDKSIHYSTNAIGFRGSEPPVPFEQYYTIFTVGGSTTECSLLDDTKTWSYLLNNQLSKDVDSMWLNNAGIDGCSTYGHEMLLSEHIFDYNPNMIVFLVGINEVYASVYTDTGDVFLQTSTEFKVRKLVQKSRLLLFLWNFYKISKTSNYQIGHSTKKIPDDLTREEFEEKDPFHQNDQSAYRKRLTKIIEDCLNRNIVPVLVTQPVYHLTPYHPLSFVKYYNETTREVGMKYDVMTINLDEKLEDNERYYYDEVHYTNEGAAKVAEIIYGELKDHEAFRERKRF